MIPRNIFGRYLNMNTQLKGFFSGIFVAYKSITYIFKMTQLFEYIKCDQ